MNAILHPEKVVLTDALCACHAVHTLHAHHRNFPDVHVEGQTPGDAAVQLADRLLRVLDTVNTTAQREQVEQALADVRAFIARCPCSDNLSSPGAQTGPDPATRVIDTLLANTASAPKRSGELSCGKGLQVIRLVLPPGTQLPTHAASGEATILCLEGLLDFRIGKANHRVGPGQMLHLFKGERHAVSALQPSTILITLARQ
jgi:quercetin dioxygenase-like cupin family protein